MKKIQKFFGYCCLLIWLSFGGCSDQLPPTISSSPQSNNSVETSKPMITNNEPPTTVINAVRQEVEKVTAIEASNLDIQDSEAKTWSDGCLGLAKPDEFCTQALVEGWRIVISDSSQTWVYRTDGEGRVIRLESQR